MIIGPRAAAVMIGALCASCAGAPAQSSPNSPSLGPVRVAGEITVSDVNGLPTVGGLRAQLDGRDIGYHGAYDYCAASSSVALDPAFGGNVAPGTHELVVSFMPSGFGMVCPPAGRSLFTEPSSQYRVVNLQTGEVVATVPLSRREVVGGGEGRETFRWSIEVGATGPSRR